MLSPQSCDFAVWDIDGTLTTHLKTELTQRRRHVGPKLSVVVGRWRDRTVAIGSPNRLTAAMLPTPNQGVRAMLDAHQPARLVIVGPASTSAGTFEIGDVVLDVDSTLGEKGEALRAGYVMQGAIIPPLEAAVVTDWALSAAIPAEERGTVYEVLAVVTQLADVGQTVFPPRSKPVTVAREFGSWVGRLLRPGAKSPAATQPVGDRALSEALAVLLSRRAHHG